MSDFSFIPPTSVVTIPSANASAAFTSKTSEVFKEERNIAPIIINDKMKYIPWGGDNQMPYNIIDLIESDETMSTCQMFNAEVCYGSGLVYDTELSTAQVQAQVDDFMLDNDLASYFLGVCQDFKHHRHSEQQRLAKGNVFQNGKNQKQPNSLKTMDIKKSKQEATFSKQKNKGLALPIPLSVSFIVQYDSI